MKNTFFIIAALAISGSASANVRYILRYTESEPLPVFLNRYGLRLQSAIPQRPIYSVIDPQARNPQALIQRISDDTDDDVSIERDQLLRLPILSFPSRQTSSLNTLNGVISRSGTINFFGVNAPSGAALQYAIPATTSNSSWSAHGLGAGTVAVIDTGVDIQHPFFAGRLVPGFDLLTDRGSGSELTGLTREVMALINPTTTPLLRTRITFLSNGTAPLFPPGYSSDPNYGKIPLGLGHGTMVAGAIRLVAPNAKIMPIRAFNQSGVGRLYDVIRGMHLAELSGARIVNLSLNTYTYSPELETSAQELSDRGVILVASTGNDGLTNPPSYPAALPKVTGVASVGPTGLRSSFSNAGNSLTWVAAPGEALLLPFPGNRWAGGWGTSFSAPLVSGLAAKVLQAKPNATYSDLQSALGRSRATGDQNLGLGLLDVFQSVDGL